MPVSIVDGKKPERKKEYTIDVRSKRVESDLVLSRETKKWASKLRYKQKHSLESYPAWYEDVERKGPRAILEEAASRVIQSRKKSDMEIFGVLVSELSKRHDISADIREILSDESVRELIS